MLKVHCLITATFHVGERQTLNHKVAGSILTLRRPVVCLSKALIQLAKYWLNPGSCPKITENC